MRKRTLRKFSAVASVVLMAMMVVCGNVPTKGQRASRVKRTTNVSITPKIPFAERNPEFVFLEHADRLFRNENEDYMILSGNVEFSKGGMRMYTDSAHYYDATGSFNAFGNVRMEQGDTLFIYGDELNYDGLTEIADLFGYDGVPVRLINRDVKLETDIFTYDMYEDLGYYNTGGVLTDRENRLESLRGEYDPKTKEANFYSNVVLTSHRPDDELRLVNNELYYNTETHLAIFHVPTVITNKDGRIDSDDGVYNTEKRQAELYQHSIVTMAKGSSLEGDTLFYDRVSGIGEAWGNMALVDTAKQSMLFGDYGFYDEIRDSAFVTGHAVAMEFSKGDTLYIHGRYLISVMRPDTLQRVVGVDTVFIENYEEIQPSVELPDSLQERLFEPQNAQLQLNEANDSITPVNSIASIASLDSIGSSAAGDSIASLPQFTLVERKEEYVDTTHVISAWPRVRIFRSDMQGVCDSLVFTQADSIVHMHYHPIVWSEDRQIFGNTILLHVNDSTVESATLPDFGFMAQLIEDQFYNQLTGKSMKAWFVDGQLNRTLVEGSVEGIVYPEEADSTINKLVNFKTANLDGYFENQVMKRMKLWSQTSGEAVPLYLAKYTDLHLPQFKWFTGIRPQSPDDIFIIPADMEELMSDRPVTVFFTIPKPVNVEDEEEWEADEKLLEQPAEEAANVDESVSESEEPDTTNPTE